MSRAKPPRNSPAGGSRGNFPPYTPAELEMEESRRRALLSMLEDLEENRLKIERASREWVATFDAILDPVFMHDADYRILRANRAYAKRAGLPVQEVIGKPYWQVYPKTSGPLASCLRALQKAEEEEEVILANGESLRSRAFTVRDASGGYLYSIHILEDVTEKHRTEAERRLLSEALRQAASGLVVVNTDLSIRYANPATTDLLGYETGQLDGLPLISVIPNDLHERVPTLQALLDAGSQWTGEFFLVAKDGARIPIHLALSSTTDAKGKAIAYLGSLLDLRPIKQAQTALEKSAEQLQATLTDTIGAVARTVEQRDPYTAGHQSKVAILCVAIGREMKLPEDRIEGLRLAALIHDIGKIYVPAEILNRPGKLTVPEFEMIKTHPQIGYDIIKDVKFPWPVAQIILQHHERLDGTGYPRGLKGEEILLEACILTVADVVEAMSSHRPYRPQLGPEAALAEINAHRGTWYDPAAVDACMRLFKEKGFTLEHP